MWLQSILLIGLSSGAALAATKEFSCDLTGTDGTKKVGTVKLSQESKDKAVTTAVTYDSAYDVPDTGTKRFLALYASAVDCKAADGIAGTVNFLEFKPDAGVAPSDKSLTIGDLTAATVGGLHDDSDKKMSNGTLVLTKVKPVSGTAIAKTNIEGCCPLVGYMKAESGGSIAMAGSAVLAMSLILPALAVNYF